MAVCITEMCINCGACEPECPNEAISEGKEIYVVDPRLCTECVGFHDYEACQAVCPVECCVPDPTNPETEAALYRRTQRLHPDMRFPSLSELPHNRSHFRRRLQPPAPVPPVTPNVVDLTQTPGKMHPDRLLLRPGRYVFRIRNVNVEHPVELRIWRVQGGRTSELVSARVRPVRAGQVANSLIVELTAGSYTFRCPRNPTPSYSLTVK